MDHLAICLIIFLLTIISFIVARISMGTTALLCLLALVFAGCLEPTAALSGFANPNTIVMASMFIVAAGLNKTQLVTKMSGMVSRISGGSFTKVLAGYIVIICILTQFIQSSMAVFSIVFPIAMGMCKELKISPSKMVFSLGICSIATVTTLPIGSGAAEYAKYNGFLESYGYTTFEFGFWDICIARLPIMIFIIIYAIFIAPKFAPKEPVVATGTVESKGLGSSSEKPLTQIQEILGYIIFIGVLVGLIFQVQLNIPSWQITLTGAALMIASGILKPKDAYTAISMGGMVVLYVGMLALGTALTETGAGAVIGDLLAGIAGNTTNGYLIGLMFFLVPFVLTQFMMNVSVMNIFTPIAIVTCQSLGCNPVGPLILIMVASLAAYMTPLATPTVSMIMGLGGYDLKTMMKMSWLPAILICIIAVGWVMTIFPAFP